jgi:hypothetical protein
VRTCLAPTPTLPTVQLTAIAQGQTSIALQAVYPGIPFAATYNFESAASAGGPFTSLVNQPANQYTDISLSPSTTRFYRVRMQFRQPQQGGLFTGYSTVASATTQAVTNTVGNTTKLILGNGCWFDNQYWNGAAQQVQYNTYVAGLLQNPLIRIIELVFTWGVMEDALRGHYTGIFGIIDGVLATLKTQKNYKVGLIFKQWQTFFNTQNITSTGDWPQYVINNNWIDAFTDLNANLRTQLKWDIDDIWAAQTAMFSALGDRYNADDHVLAVGLGDETVAVDVTANKGTVINATHYNAKYKQMCLDVKAHWLNTFVWVPFNFLPPGGTQSASAMIDMITTFRQQYPGGFLFGGPDPATNHNVHGNTNGSWITTFQNLITGYSAGLGNLTGVVPLISHVEEFTLGNRGNPPSDPGITPLQLYDDAVNLYKAQILIWNHQNWEFYKWADQLAAITTRNGVTASVPSEGKFTLL